MILTENDICNLVKESVLRLVSEGATSVLYHFINLEYLQDLLKRNSFRTCEPEVYFDGDETKYINGKNLRFISFTRNGNPYEGYPIIKYGEWGDGELSCICRLTIDGNALNRYSNFKDEHGKRQNLKVNPIDWAWYDGTGAENGYSRDGKSWMMQSDGDNYQPNYRFDKMYSKLDKKAHMDPHSYSDVYHHPYSQAEDRLVTTAEFIPNASKFITAIDIYVRSHRRDKYVKEELEELKPTIINIKKLAASLGIPVNIYYNVAKMRKDRVLRKNY